MPAVWRRKRVEEVDHLSRNIGYLKVSGFPPAFLMAEKYAAAMEKLADTDALIVDVRDNRGGGPQSVALLISYFVDGRTRLNDIWDRDTGITMQHWTEDKLDGKRYGGKKPVVILAGPGTMSAGEDFTYTMQALKRATVIGEPTWGGAHPTRPYRLGDHFSAWIPARRFISPITHTNWEGVGVIPDIAATPDNALAVAKDLLQRRLQGTAPLVAVGHCDIPPTDERAGKRQERLVHVCPPRMSNLEDKQGFRSSPRDRQYVAVRLLAMGDVPGDEQL
jgi:C-terminal processing protease CtpA/Prc